MTTVANCESNGEANKIHLSRAIFDKLRTARYSNDQPIFDLGFIGSNQKTNLVGDFEIEERKLDFGNAEQRRKTKSSFEVLGQTFFLIRDRFEKKNQFHLLNFMVPYMAIDRFCSELDDYIGFR